MRAASRPIAHLLSEAAALRQAGRLNAALSVLEKALTLDPNNAQIHCERGNLFLIWRRYTEAANCFHVVLDAKEDHVEALSNLGNALQGLNRAEEAVHYLKNARLIQPDAATIHFNLGNALLSLTRYQEAIDCYNKAISLAPGYAKAYCNKGNALQALFALPDAVKAYKAAIQADPNYADPYNNCGNALKHLGQFDTALSYYNKAIQCDPYYADAYWNRGLLKLLNGNFEEGWSDYQWRPKRSPNGLGQTPSRIERYKAGQNFTNKTVLLHAEQGLGDTIQFCRYATSFADLGARVVIAAPTALVDLLQTVPGVSEVITQDECSQAFDYQFDLLSTPYFFGTRQETIPHRTPYLTNDLNKVKTWEQALGKKQRLRIGLAWSGNSAHQNDVRRSIQLDELLPFLPAHHDYTCLQKEIREVDQKALKSNGPIRVVSDLLHDFSDTAALIACMDIVISVDTSIAHLAGALAKPTWVLLARVPDWRWLLDRQDSPWYPSVTLYRQTDDTWLEAFKKLQSDLTHL